MTYRTFRSARVRPYRRVKQLSYNDVDEMATDLQEMGSDLTKSIGEWVTRYKWHEVKKTLPASEILIKQWLELINAHDAFKRELTVMILALEESQDKL